MKKVCIIFAFLAAASMAAFAEHWTGYVSDEKCAVGGSKAKRASDWIKPDAFLACAQKCAKSGSAIVFVTEDNQILKFDAESLKQIVPFVGQRVSLDGKLEKDTLKVDKVAVIKMDFHAKPSSDQEDKMHGQNDKH